MYIVIQVFLQIIHINVVAHGQNLLLISIERYLSGLLYEISNISTPWAVQILMNLFLCKC